MTKPQTENYEKPILIGKKGLDLAHDLMFVESYFQDLEHADEIIEALGKTLAFSRTVKKSLDKLNEIGENALHCKQILKNRPELNKIGYDTERLNADYMSVRYSLILGMKEKRTIRERTLHRIKDSKAYNSGLTKIVFSAYNPQP